jgi:hypothetical protein
LQAKLRRKKDKAAGDAADDVVRKERPASCGDLLDYDVSEP